MQRVKEYGGRFLERGNDGLWHQMNEKAARKKASQGELQYLTNNEVKSYESNY